MLRQYFNCNERLEIFLTCLWNIMCYVESYTALCKTISKNILILNDSYCIRKLIICFRYEFYKYWHRFDDNFVKIV